MMTDRYIGDYKILKQIGAGGMAKVYLAVHKDVPNLQVVLKVLSDPRQAERFKQEADKLALLDKNPNVCKIRHFFNHGDELVIAMEYIEGRSLEEILKEEKTLPIPKALGTVLDIISALEPAHEQGIFHRDIKPSNIMFARGGQVKIIDFGIAKGKTDPQLTIVGTAAGTPEYMAPEQFEAREDLDYAKCDIYAVGTMLFRMLTGELPFKGANEFILRDSKLYDTPVTPSKLNGEVNKELDSIVIKSINSEPDKRFDSIAEMKSALQPVCDHYKKTELKPKIVETTPDVDKYRPSVKSRPVKTALGLRIIIGAIIVVAAAFAAYKIIPRGDNSSRPVVVETSDEQTTSDERTESEDQTAPDDRAAAEQGRETVSKNIPPEERIQDRRSAEQPTPRPAPGRIVVGSRPRYGDIYIDGVLQKEKTPYTFDAPPGQHVVKIVLTVDNVERVYYKTVTVTSGGEIKVFYNSEEKD